MVVFDATILLSLVSPNLRGFPVDPGTNKPVTLFKERIEFLVSELERTRTKIIIPTPTLSEVLVYADRATLDYVNLIRQSSAFRIEAFDDRAAVEVAMMIRAARQQMGDKRAGSKKTWAQVKFDYQIVAIAKVNSATAIYTDDPGLEAFARRVSRIPTIGIHQLVLPMSAAQSPLEFPKKEEPT